MKRTYTALPSAELISDPVEEKSDEAAPEEEGHGVLEEESISKDDEGYVPTDEKKSSDEEPKIKKTCKTTDNLQSKDGQILWSSFPPKDRRHILGATRLRSPRGPTRYALSRADSIKSTFELFMSKDIQEIVLDMSNKEGCRVYGDSWKAIDKIDLQGYLGLLILAGVYRSSKETTSSLWHAQTGRAIFSATMALKKFQIISRILHFDDRKTRPARSARDKMAPIREIWDKWVYHLQQMYNPGIDVTVDERLVPFRGRCIFKQYMVRKRGKYGIKIWVACDAQSSYAWNMQVYTGKPVDGQPEKNQGQHVVLDMTQGLEGHIITCNNFFTSYVLGQRLLKRKMAMVGTIRKNNPELPSALTEIRDRANLSSKFVFTDTHALVSYCTKKNQNILLMSTLHRDTKVSRTEAKKPQIILDYNKNKGGVDNLDKITSVYSCKRMTARWSMMLFFNMIDVSAYNSFVLWGEINPSWNQGKYQKRRLFLQELGRELVTPLIERRPVLPRVPASASLVKEVQNDASTSAAGPFQPSAPPPPSPRKRCKFCTNDNKTSTRCQNCKAHICRSHSIVICLACK